MYVFEKVESPEDSEVDVRRRILQEENIVPFVVQSWTPRNPRHARFATHTVIVVVGFLYNNICKWIGETVFSTHVSYINVTRTDDDHNNSS